MIKRKRKTGLETILFVWQKDVLALFQVLSRGLLMFNVSWRGRRAPDRVIHPGCDLYIVFYCHICHFFVRLSLWRKKNKNNNYPDYTTTVIPTRETVAGRQHRDCHKKQKKITLNPSWGETNTSPHHTIHFWGSSSGFWKRRRSQPSATPSCNAALCENSEVSAGPEGVRHTQLSCCSERRQAGDFPLPLMSLVPLF